MLRPENAVAGNVHHTVAHRSADKHTYLGHDQYSLERGRFRAYSRVQKVDSVVAHPHRQIEYRQQKKEDHNAEKQYVHVA